MKPKIIQVLNQCKINQSNVNKFQIDRLIKTISHDNTVFDSIKEIDSSFLYISLWVDRCNLVSIAFIDDNSVIYSLACQCNYRFNNTNDDMLYDEIKALLLGNNNQ